MKLLANAKVNLTLNITNKRSDGYHDLKSIIYPIALCDELSLEDSDVDIVTYNVPIENDIIIRTVQKMKEKFNISKCVRVDVVKHIPIQAGLGGGSADAAAVIRGLNVFWNINAPLEQLAKVAIELGSDVPFCLYNKPALVKGKGDQVSALPHIESYVLLVTPDRGVSTAEAFERIGQTTLVEKDITNQLIMIGKGQLKELASSCFNDFHIVAQNLSEECYVLTRQLQKVNPNFCLTGSGSTFFALYDSLDTLREDEKRVHEMEYKTIHTTLLS